MLEPVTLLCPVAVEVSFLCTAPRPAISRRRHCRLDHMEFACAILRVSAALKASFSRLAFSTLGWRAYRLQAKNQPWVVRANDNGTDASLLASRSSQTDSVAASGLQGNGDKTSSCCLRARSAAAVSGRSSRAPLGVVRSCRPFAEKPDL